jgi:hypothetical protein
VAIEQTGTPRTPEEGINLVAEAVGILENRVRLQRRLVAVIREAVAAITVINGGAHPNPDMQSYLRDNPLDRRILLALLQLLVEIAWLQAEQEVRITLGRN